MFLQRLHGGWSFPTHLIFILRHASHAPASVSLDARRAPVRHSRSASSRVEGEGRSEKRAGPAQCRREGRRVGEPMGRVGVRRERKHSRDGASTRELVSYTTSSKPSSEDMLGGCCCGERYPGRCRWMMHEGLLLSLVRPSWLSRSWTGPLSSPGPRDQTGRQALENQPSLRHAPSRSCACACAGPMGGHPGAAPDVCRQCACMHARTHAPARGVLASYMSPLPNRPEAGGSLRWNAAPAHFTAESVVRALAALLAPANSGKTQDADRAAARGARRSSSAAALPNHRRGSEWAGGGQGGTGYCRSLSSPPPNLPQRSRRQ